MKTITKIGYTVGVASGILGGLLLIRLWIGKQFAK